jgi:hypothetical protein
MVLCGVQRGCSSGLAATIFGATTALVISFHSLQSHVCWHPARNMSQPGTSTLKPPQPGMFPAGRFLAGDLPWEYFSVPNWCGFSAEVCEKFSVPNS